MSDLITKLDINVGGNFNRRLIENSRTFNSFSKNGQRQLSLLSRSMRGVSSGLDRIGNRYTGLLTGAAGAGTARFLIGLEKRFERIGIQADISSDQVDSLKKEIYATAQAANRRIDPSELTAAVEEIVEKTGDLKFAQDNLDNLAASISATGAMGRDIGGLAAEFQKMDIKQPKLVAEALDILTVQGKEGAFTLENLATLGARVTTAYTAMGRTGVPAIREMGAALQVIRQGTGTSEMAATAFEALLRTLSDPEKVKVLQSGGIQIFEPDALKNGQEILRPINELMEEIVKRTSGKKTILGKIFDAEAVRAFNAALGEFNRTGEMESLERFYNVQADGTTIQRDSARAAKTADAAMQSLYTAWQKFADANLTQHIQSLAGAIDQLEPETVDRVIKSIVYGITALAGLSVLSKSARVIKGAADVFGKGKGGVPGKLSSAMATPVWVVNMPGGGMMPGGAAGKVGKGARTPGRFGLLRAAPNLKTIGMMGAGAMGTAGLALGGAGLAGYGVGTGIYKGLLEDTQLADSIGAAIAKSLAFFGNDKAQAAVASRSRLEIELKGANASVRSIESNDMDISVDTGPVMQ
jgi:hypothetical protein